MSKISEYAKEHRLPLVVACGGGIEGEGILYQISKSQAKVRYDGFDKKYNLPDDLDMFVLVDNYYDEKMRNAYKPYLPSKKGGMEWPNENYGNYLKTKDIRALSDDNVISTIKQEFPIRQRKVSRYEGEQKIFTHDLFGMGAGDIDFDDARDFVVALAYLATPNRCSLIADVPPNHYAEFDEKFPYAHYGHTKSHEGSSCQFTIAVHDTTDIPLSLSNEVMPSDVEKLGGDESVRIIRSAFCYDLVDCRGFVFGNEQDVEAIRNKVPEGLRDIFDEYYEEFSKEICLEER